MEDGGDGDRTQTHLEGAAVIQLHVACRPHMTRSFDFFFLREAEKSTSYVKYFLHIG